LCGLDSVTGKDFDHRRGWIENRILELQTAFCIDVCAYAVMSNHYHVVLYVDQAQCEGLATAEVIERWQGLFNGTLLTQRYALGEPLSQAELQAVEEKVAVWRARLMDISWFIRCVNEWVAKEANAEDGCTGRFWEGRYKSQALLDEKALAACMAYVDLNPVRAAMAKVPEASEYTSVKQRSKQAKQSVKSMTNPNHIKHQPKDLMPFVGNPRMNMPKGLPFALKDYLELVDWTGRQVRANKRGSISSAIPPLLERMGMEPDKWMMASCHFEARFKCLVGARQSLSKACDTLNFLRVVGVGASRLFS